MAFCVARLYEQSPTTCMDIGISIFVRRIAIVLMCFLRGMIVDCIVIGKGRAGAARVRTIEQHPDCTLVRYVSGRDFHIPLSKERALYFVCTENKKHYAMSKTILKYGHHVAVEFPPCMTQEEWNTLVSLANQKHLILH